MKLFKHTHKWVLSERSNIIQFDDMGYPLRLFICQCKKCGMTEQMWIDSAVSKKDHVCEWTKDVAIPISRGGKRVGKGV